MTDYKSTLNLPYTDFPMKARLPQHEPNILKYWSSINLYTKLRVLGKNREKFILHDGPPYANGNIHIGHALNKILKDIVIRSKTLAGFDAPYVPGWDCHGLPIEHKIEVKYGKGLPANETQRLCRSYAEKQIVVQKDEFLRLGVVGDFENPYKTMSFENEANIIRSLAKLVEGGFIFKGLKPVNWCFDCKSALAEAEIEYHDKSSTAIDVSFLVSDEMSLSQAFGLEPLDKPTFVVVWTTTPWSIPANQALNVHPEFIYTLVDVGEKLLILAEGLVNQCLSRYKIQGKVIARTLGKNLELINCLHPIYPRCSPIHLADYIKADSGTGIVHSSPAYGIEDFIVAKNYGVNNEDILQLIQDNGVYVSYLDFFGGEFIWRASSKIICKLKEVNALVCENNITHSYMHCWRHKTPLIYRATEQWFIGMDKLSSLGEEGDTLRNRALAAIENINFSPEWGKSRLRSMIASRPDWCISRQRNWGTPITFFVSKKTGELHPNTIDLMEEIAKKVALEGIEGWHNLDINEVLGDSAHLYEKVHDTLDVWFDSGTTHRHVLHSSHPIGHKTGAPANLYFEGSDQYRGWFQSSLLTSCGMNKHAPYLELITHGFTVDKSGCKMSKSLGNVISPKEIYSTLGADVLRLWVSSTDFSTEITVSDEILRRSSDAYRRIRNTVRFLLSNLKGFDPSTNSVPIQDMLILDRWILDRALILQEDLKSFYGKYNFWKVYSRLHKFCVHEMGGFYLDIIKDRLYTMAEDSKARRSAQTALFHISEALVRWIAPILAFTAEEIWSHLPGKHNESVMLNTWYEGLTELPEYTPMNRSYWERIMEIKIIVNKEIEKLRISKEVRSTIETSITLFVSDNLYRDLQKLGNELRFVLITSEASVKSLRDAPEESVMTSLQDVRISIASSKYTKCARCWQCCASIGLNREYPDICSRCITNIYFDGEVRLYV